MLESIEFQNFKVLRDARLPLGPCTILIGPNGSGKSTVLEALEAVSGKRVLRFPEIVSADLRGRGDILVEIRFHWAVPDETADVRYHWMGGKKMELFRDPNQASHPAGWFDQYLNGIVVYSFDAKRIAAPVEMTSDVSLAQDGSGLAGVLMQLRNRHRDRFHALESELTRWLPEFTCIHPDFDPNKQCFLALETTEGHHRIPASDLSQGTLIALTILTLAYVPGTPSMVCLEEPDRGIHPRLLRRVQDAIYRLSYPESCGEKRDPIQVIATTHSPYFLDLFKDHPEEIVVANRDGLNVRFERVSDNPDIGKLLEDSHLGDIWYTGLLGGVPTGS